MKVRMGIVLIWCIAVIGVSSCGSRTAGSGEACGGDVVCVGGLSCKDGVCRADELPVVRDATHESVGEVRNDGAVPRDIAEPSVDEPAREDVDAGVSPDDAGIDAAPIEVKVEPMSEQVRDASDEPVADAVPDAVPDAGEPWLTVPIKAVRVSHDDGTKRASVTPAQVSQWVRESNRVYRVAKMAFSFDPQRDFIDVKSTVLNRISGHTFPDWRQALAEGNRIAARYPDAFIAVFRHGRDANATGGGFGWTDYDFFVMPGFDKTFVCRHQNITLFAHELGHYLGLRHTFQQIYQRTADAQRAWDAAKDPLVFDGDGLTDTHPDAFTRDLQCTSALQMTLSGQTLPIPRDNIMSYHDDKNKTLSAQQISIIRQVALLRLSKPLTGLIPGATVQIEGESLVPVAGHVGRTSVQRMTGFHGRWSQGAHRWWAGAMSGKFVLTLPVQKPGKYRVYAILTRASDFGVHAVSLNGSKAGTVDLYAKYVRHSAPVDLGVHDLKGNNELSFEAQRKNARSRGYGLGLDAILLRPVP